MQKEDLILTYLDIIKSQTETIKNLKINQKKLENKLLEKHRLVNGYKTMIIELREQVKQLMCSNSGGFKKDELIHISSSKSNPNIWQVIKKFCS